MRPYRATKAVRHLTFWTADDEAHQAETFVRGSWRPICGRRLLGDVTTGQAGGGGTPRAQRHEAAIARRPICRDCTRELANMLRDLQSDEHDEHDEHALERALAKLASVDTP